MISPKEAAESLKDARRTERRSGIAFGYSLAAPHLIVWGLVWFAGYGGSDLWPAVCDLDLGWVLGRSA